ncbi:fimbrial biogenesis chaperone [Dyella telluris]|uniref:Fimbria/pilus periplasmic chaperone n=1 Tax=Dyella telluris TaxID=2763498 RepID=A0A7G8Q8E1_9GAMM|nr:fimbria/pilus periplasmic chaperone [Dyella telluris]QNK03049.1 fimbria/pilus periplasmic chaperone [Dyella telluris]
MNSTIRALSGALLAAVCVFAGTSHASVIITGTRVVFPAKAGEVTVRLTNQNSSPALVESWIDDGDAQSTPDKVNTPFLITPPLFRMEPNRDQSLRIMFTHSDQPLPADRESVFYLNVLEVPPKPNMLQAQAPANYMQFAIRSRLKLFYRPDGLQGDPAKAPSQVTFKAAMKNGNAELVVHNPTPYYVTISHVSVTTGGAAHKGDSGMVAPMADLHLAIPGLTQAPAAGSAIEYGNINDFGADTTLKGTVSP